MNRSLTIKVGVIALLSALLMIPLQMIDGLIFERQQLRNEVLQDIARSSSFSQKLIGPVLVVPYYKKVTEWAVDPSSQARQQIESEVEGRFYYLPDRFDFTGNMTTELRHRGIYEARLYHANNKIKGHFSLPARLDLEDEFENYRFDKPFIAFAISDIRGINNALKLNVNGNEISFQPGTGVPELGNGVHAPLPALTIDQINRLEFSIDLDIQGTGQFDITPVGKETVVKLTSNWPHPSFIGNYLPASQTIDEKGFSAEWRTSLFSTNLESAMENCFYRTSCDEFTERRFGVSLIDPVDQYLKSERAIKYALLFVALTFAGFFLFEVLKQMAIHPIQYGLVGIALALFYLLLISLSEHIGFTFAYLVSSSSCALLVGVYVSCILRSALHGGVFSVSLAALYGLLYGLLSSEDYALLMGALLLFGLLGVVMILTRKVDWYSIGKPIVQETGQSASE